MPEIRVKREEKTEEHVPAEEEEEEEEVTVKTTSRPKTTRKTIPKKVTTKKPLVKGKTTTRKTIHRNTTLTTSSSTTPATGTTDDTDDDDDNDDVTALPGKGISGGIPESTLLPGGKGGKNNAEKAMNKMMGKLNDIGREFEYKRKQKPIAQYLVIKTPHCFSNLFIGHFKSYPWNTRKIFILTRRYTGYARRFFESCGV